MKSNKRILFSLILTLIIVGLGFVFLTRKLTRKETSSNLKQYEEIWNVKIVAGDIYKVYDSAKKELLVSKTDIDDEVIENFVVVTLSPDRSKICFVGQSMVPQWLYYANIDGSGITQIGLGKNCVWSNSSQKIAYNNHTTDVSPVDVLVYDLLLKSTKNYTADVQSTNLIRAYESPVWSENDNEITSKFSSLAMDGTGTTKGGTSMIDLASGQISDK